MKILRMTTAVGLVLTALLSLGAMTAAAQGPIAFLDNTSHTLAANASQLYRFDYAVDTLNNVRPVTTITLVNATNSGLGFQVWTPETVNDMADNKPIGIGTPQTVDCNTGEITAAGGCQSPDLTWSGAFGTSGTYYVLVTNNTNNQLNYMFKVQGSGVSLGQQQASAPSAPAAAPALAATTDDPAKAAAINGQQASIPAGGATWYRFDYALNSDGTRPLVAIKMPNATNSGVSFQVWSPDTLSGGWWNNKPIGIGTPQTVDCNTGEITGAGGCESPDLTWSGTFGATGTYFVRVVNSNNATSNYTLQMTTQ
jgi:hypothetical protein